MSYTREEIADVISNIHAEIDKLPRQSDDEQLYALFGHYTLELLGTWLINQARIADALELIARK